MGQAAWTHHDKSSPRVDTCSQVQQDLWYAERLALPGAGAHLALALRIDGESDGPALRAACRDVLDGQPDLLSRFPARQGRPERMPLDDAAAERARTVVRLDGAAPLAAHLAAPFDVDAGPLLRFGVTDEDGRTVLLAVFHHLVFDGLSRDVVAREWIRCYRARREGRQPGAGSAVPYHGHIERERVVLATEPPSGWRDTFAWDGAALSDVLHSPPDTAVTPVAVRLGDDRSARLTVLAGEAGASRHTTLLATFAATLAVYASAPGLDVPAVAVPMDTRSAEFTGTVGPFVNEAPLRLAPGPREDFRTFLQRVRRQTATAYRFRSFPLTDLRRRVGSTPWRPSVVFGYRRAGLPELIRTPDLTVGYQSVVPVGHASTELELQLLDRGTDLGGWLGYDPARFASGALRDVLDHWYRMIDLVTATPRRPLSSLCVLDGRQRRRISALSTGPVVRFDGPDTVPDLIAAQAAATPGHIAVRDDGRSVRYAELDQLAADVAERLRGAGVRAEDPVLVCVPRSVALVAALLGVWKAGACYVPLDPDDPPARQASMAAGSGATVLLAGPADAPVPDFAGTVVRLGATAATGPDDDTAAHRPASRPVTGDRVAYAMYTSGSTGAPKAAMVGHAALRNRLLWMQDAYRLTARDRVLHKAAIGFDVSGWETFWPLTQGATLVLTPPDTHRDSARLVRLMRAEAVTVAHFVPSALRAVLDEPDIASCPNLRLVVCSGEALPADLVERFHDRLRCQLENLYGPTEAAIDVTAAPCPPGTDPVPIGSPIANAVVRVLDPGLRPVPVGVTGEICLGGTPLAVGYLGRPGLTAQRFVPDPDGEGGRLYRTGDLGRFRYDGLLEFQGRVDHQVKIRGRRIEPGEIEAVLHSHPAVRRAAVIGADTGRGEQELLGYLVAATPDARPDVEQLDRFLRSRLPDAMVPRALVWLDELPRTASGKLDRRALPAPREAGDGYVAPRTDAERAVATIWAELFELDRVGAHDNFFDLGGHSLLATRTLSRLRDRFGVELPMRLVFDRPTVTALAAAVDEERAG